MGTRSTSVAIAGGGVVGSLMALGLAQRDIDCVVVDPKHHSATASWGTNLWPFALQVMKDLGLQQSVVEKGRPLLSLASYNAGNGKQWGSTDLRTLPNTGEFRGFAFDELTDSVVTASADPRIRRLSATALSTSRTGAGGWRLECERADQKSEVVEADYLIVAEGRRSRLLKGLGITLKQGRLEGQELFTCLTRSNQDAADIAGMEQHVGDGFTIGRSSAGHTYEWGYRLVNTKRVTGGASSNENDYDAELKRLFAEAEPDRQATIELSESRADQICFDRGVVIGDAAYGLYPQLGLGGSGCIESLPKVVELVAHALKNSPSYTRRVEMWEAATRTRMDYLARVSRSFCKVLATRSAFQTKSRHLAFIHQSRNPQYVEDAIIHIAKGGVPPLGVRLKSGMM